MAPGAALTRIRFGTSGWRARVAEDFTFGNVKRLTQAIARWLAEHGVDRPIVVGHDTRFLAEEFAGAVASVLAGNGFRVLLSNRDCPTPTVSHAIRDRKAAGGIMLTASHNPAEWNGLKFSAENGGPALPEVTRAIEAVAAETDSWREVPIEEAERQGLIERADFRRRYLDHLGTLVDRKALGRARLSVVVDVMHGPARDYLDAFLAEAGATVHVLHGNRDVLFGGHHPEPAAEQLKELTRAVVELNADLGLATDGDADRFGVVDGDGRVIDPNHVLGLVARHLLRRRGWRGALARSVATTHLLDGIAGAHGLICHETPVGFKYLGDLIDRGEVIFGGEESAGLSIRGHVPEKDGILAGLLAAEIVAVEQRLLGEVLTEIFGELGGFYPARINLPLSPEDAQALAARLDSPPERLGGRRVLRTQQFDGLKLHLEGSAWALVRPSGTEPVVRLYVEARSEKERDELVDSLRAFVQG